MSKMKIHKMFLSLTLAIFSVVVFASDYSVDKNSSSVKWTGKKVTGKHWGKILFESGNIEVKKNRIVGGTFTMDMTSFTVDDMEKGKWHDALIEHLQSDDFFSVAEYKTATLVLLNAKTQDGNKYQFEGNLTIKGKSNIVKFEAEVDLNQGEITATGQMTIDRTIYGMKFNSGKFFTNLGDKLVYDDFTLDFKLIAKK